MIWLRLTWANLTLSMLTTTVNVVLMALGTASIVMLLLAGSQLRATMSRDAEGIDLVLGAAGSPVQLVLSSVYHADVPPGNIPLDEAQRWLEDPRVEWGIPLSLGDSLQGYRIVGTKTSYIELYGGELAAGAFWLGNMEAVLGSAVAEATEFELGSSFAGAHGLGVGGHDHQSQSYRVVGVLKPTGTILDRLIITSLESVWQLHGITRAHEDEHEDEDEQEDEHEHLDSVPDTPITAMLLHYRNPLAALTLPRQINATGALQAAAPALEIARILQVAGVGLRALGAFAWVLVATAALSIFAALYGSLRSRRGELAMLRCLGATRAEILWFLILEGLMLAALGIVFGFLLGHWLTELVGAWLNSNQSLAITGWIWVSAEYVVFIGLLLVGAGSAVVPALQAYRTDVARALVKP